MREFKSGTVSFRINETFVWMREMKSEVRNLAKLAADKQLCYFFSLKRSRLWAHSRQTALMGRQKKFQCNQTESSEYQIFLDRITRFLASSTTLYCIHKIGRCHRDGTLRGQWQMHITKTKYEYFTYSWILIEQAGSIREPKFSSKHLSRNSRVT